MMESQNIFFRNLEHSFSSDSFWYTLLHKLKKTANFSAMVSASTQPSTWTLLLTGPNLERQHFQKVGPSFIIILGGMTGADKIMHPQHFGIDPTDIVIRIRINPKIRIRIPDHFCFKFC